MIIVLEQARHVLMCLMAFGAHRFPARVKYALMVVARQSRLTSDPEVVILSDNEGSSGFNPVSKEKFLALLD